jgi:hypothetical protein
MLLPETHASAVLLKDHDTVKALFDRFDKAASAHEKDKIIDQAVHRACGKRPPPH